MVIEYVNSQASINRHSIHEEAHVILDDLLSSLTGDVANEGAVVKQVLIGAFWTAVVSEDCGLASTTVDRTKMHGHSQVDNAGNLVGKRAIELANLARSSSSLEATVGLAAINSLLKVDEGQFVDLNAGDYLEEKGSGKRVAVVGHFPFIPRLRRSASTLWVLEQRPGEGDLAADEAALVLPQADIVAITGTAFINHTIDNLLNLCRPNSLVMVLGPTTPLSPVLFDYGVSIISGTRVVDTELVLRCASEGATFRQMRGTRLVTMFR